MGDETIPISPIGRVVCMHAVREKLSQTQGALAYYQTVTAPHLQDHEWIVQQDLIIEALTYDLEHLSND